MRVNRLVTIVASGTCLAVASLVAGQGLVFAPPPALQVYVQPTTGMGPVYVVPPHPQAWSTFYFVGEPLTVQVELRNEAGAHAVLRARNAPRIVEILVRHLVIPDVGGPIIPLDGPVVDVPVRHHERPSRVYRGVVQPESLNQQIPLAPDEAIRWTADIDLGTVVPGLYVVHAAAAVAEESGLILRTSAGFRFEVRERSPDAAQEILLRAGVRALTERHYLEAERILKEMLAAFPHSAVGAMFLGDVYEQQGRRQEAREVLERARDILRAGADVALAAHPENARESPENRLRVVDQRIERLAR